MSDASRQAAPIRGGRWNLWLGIGLLGFCLLCVTLWFPRDIGSGFLEQNLTGRTVPGDAFFPVLLVGLIALLASLLILSELRHGARRSHPPSAGEAVGRISPDNLAFLLRAIIVTAVSLLAMNATGPLLVTLTNAVGLTDYSGYRAASGTFPFDISGFFVGATLLTCGYIHTTRHRLRGWDVLVALAAAGALVLLFDGLIDNVQLPPNADL
ncbi:MAG: hypothetical protein GYB17_15760 [Gammaproteobacteria bacterium]|nr:hypothetical protein [Gammaproteobacteria bacterium]